jgi:hypothetical protein
MGAIRTAAVAIFAGMAFYLSVTFLPAFSDGPENPNRPIRDKWAVVIGVSKFADPSIPGLKFPAKDAQDFRDFLIAKGNFARDHVLLLTDQKATRVGVIDACGDGWLPRRVLEDDLVVVYISSHGSPADSAGENFVMAYDSDPKRPYATGIRLQDLSNEIARRTGCDRLVVLLDACHSGAAVEGRKGLVRTQSNFNLETITGEGQLVISSSQPDQVSWESKRYDNGVFTRQLIGALQAGGANTTIRDAFEHLKSSVDQEVRFDRKVSQKPMLLSKWKGEALALCAPPSVPRNVLPDVPEEKPAANVNHRVGVTAVKPVVPVDHRVEATAVKPVVPVDHSVEVTAVKPGTASVQTSSTRTAQTPQGSQLNPPMMTTSWIAAGGDTTLESGTRLLSEQELRGRSTQFLMRLNNEIYARHGRGFASADLRSYFASQSWYREDPDYHWRPDDPRVIARNHQPDDALVVNAKRTPRQWANLQLIQRCWKK